MAENTVTMSLPEYDRLKRKVEDAERIRREYEEDCERRGYIVKMEVGILKEHLIGDMIRYNCGCQGIEIKRNDELLDPLMLQIDRWKDAFEAACRRNEELERELDGLRRRGILRRIINR